MPLPSLRLLMGFTPRDLFPYLDGYVEREPCSEILVEQHLLIMRPHEHCCDSRLHYKVFNHIYPYDGTKTFSNLPEEELQPPHRLSYELMHHIQTYLRKHRPWFKKPWTVKGAMRIDKQSSAFFLPQVSTDYTRYMVLLERRKPCECHRSWKPRHKVNVVPSKRCQERLEKELEKEKAKKIKEGTRRSSSAPPTYTSSAYSVYPGALVYPAGCFVGGNACASTCC
ncbi:hypothetical protein PV05_05345 [Exophiala xenobiotica]|uniref:Uncharacterized protein n=1 Tax=Exophiala xenobiotica TaxID=348802 RepID=A0A0D2EMQ8_9EURO|nr:uncharacterized protein PV05_05345 [Exophiala xenobiotica]KIW56708.1 hypothetical protein PV05_05345 [Exophiala xenobiotica]